MSRGGPRRTGPADTSPRTDAGEGRAGTRVVRRAPSAAQGAVTLVAFASMCSVLAPLNSTMIAVVLPQIRDDFGLTRGSVGWLISAYLIAMAVAQPVAGRLGDQLGRGRVVRVGLLLFIGTSVASTFAPNFPVLIVLRVAQAVFGAGLIPNAMALLRERASVGELGRLNGFNAAAIAAAAGVGPLLGAVALAAGSWRFVFPASLPFALGALALLPRLGLQDRHATGGAKSDWLGTTQYAVLLIWLTALLGASAGASVGGRLLIAWVGFVVALVWFVWRQSVSPTPAAAWGLFRVRSFAAASAQVLLTNLVMYTTLLMVPFLVNDVLHGSAGTSGLLLGVMALFMGFAAPLGGRLSDLRGRRLAAQAGAILVLVAALLLVVSVRAGVTSVQLAAWLAVLGAGVGLGTGAANTAAIESAPRALAGAAAGTSSMMRYVGSIVGAGVLAATLSAGSAVKPDASTFVALQLVIAIMAGAAALAACLIHAFPPPEEASEAEGSAHLTSISARGARPAD